FLLYASSTTDIYSLSLHDALPISRVLPALILHPSDFEIDFTTLITVPTSKSPDIVISSAYLVYLILFLIAYFAILLSRFLVIKLANIGLVGDRWGKASFKVQILLNITATDFV